MAKRSRKAEEVTADVADQFRSAATKELPTTPTVNVLDSLLGEALGTDAETPELGVEELGALESEFGDIVALTRRKATVEKELSKINAELAAQKDRMIQAMELQGTKQFKGMGDGDEACNIQERYDTTIDDVDAFMGWVQEVHPELLTVNAQTRNGFIRKEFRDKGIEADSPEFPPGIVVTPRKLLVVRGVKKPRQ